MKGIVEKIIEDIEKERDACDREYKKASYLKDRDEANIQSAGSAAYSYALNIIRKHAKDLAQ